MAERRTVGGSIVSSFLGSSNSFHQRNNDVLPMDGPESGTGRTVKSGRFQSGETPNDPDVWSSSHTHNIPSTKESVLQNQDYEKPKLRRRGSLIDWGAGAFDFSTASTGDVYNANQTPMQYKRDARISPSLICPDGGFHVDALASQGKPGASIKTEFKSVTPNMATIVEDANPNESSNTRNSNVLGKFEENTQGTYNLHEKSYTPHIESDDLTTPPKPSARSLQRRQSLLDIIEDQNIEAAPQTAVLGGLPVNSGNLQKAAVNISSCGETENEGHSNFGGILSNWFFQRSHSIEEDTVDSKISFKPQGPIEGVGGGVLTSKVLSALNMHPASKQEVGKMNSWMPASF